MANFKLNLAFSCSRFYCVNVIVQKKKNNVFLTATRLVIYRVFVWEILSENVLLIAEGFRTFKVK